jgi:hypothetical protein
VDVKGPVTLFGVEEDKYFTQLSEYRRFEAIKAAPLQGEVKYDLFAPFVIGDDSTTPQQ